MGIQVQDISSFFSRNFGIPDSAGKVQSPGTFSSEKNSNDTFAITEPHTQDLVSTKLSKASSDFVHSIVNNGSKLLYQLPLLTNFLDAHTRPILTDYPNNISLENRQKQALLGTTSHLPEWWLSDSNTGYLKIHTPNSNISQGNADISAYTFLPTHGKIDINQYISNINQGSVKILPFNFSPNQGIVVIDTNIASVIQGKVILDEFNPVINQGLINIPNYNPLIEQGNVSILPYVSSLIQGSISLLPYTPVITQGSTTISPVLVNISQGSTDVTAFSFSPIHGSTSISYTEPKVKQDAMVTINKSSTGLLGLPIFDKADLLKWSANTILTDATINKGIGRDVDNYGLGFIINSVNGNELDENNDIPFYLQRGARKKDTVYIQGVAFDTETPVINSNYDISNKSDTTDPAHGGYKQRNFIDTKYTSPGDPVKETELKSKINISSSYVDSIKTDSVISGQVKDDSVPLGQNLPGRSIVDGVDKVTSRDDKLAFSDGLYGTYATMTYAALRERSNNPGTFKDFREDVKSNKNFNSSLDNYSTKNIYTRLGLGDLGDTTKDRSNYKNNLGLEDELMKALGSSAADLVTLKFVDVRNPNTEVQFRSYIDTFSDSITPEFEENEYVGRPDKLDVYKGVSRVLNLTFLVPALTRNELKIMYQKLNFLIGLTLPDKPGQMVAPFTKFTFGDWVKSIPCNVRSITFDMDKDFVWEINMEGDKKLGELPKFVKVTMTLSVKGSAIPSLKNTSFNLAKDKF